MPKPKSLVAKNELILRGKGIGGVWHYPPCPLPPLGGAVTGTATWWKHSSMLFMLPGLPRENVCNLTLLDANSLIQNQSLQLGWKSEIYLNVSKPYCYICKKCSRLDKGWKYRNVVSENKICICLRKLPSFWWTVYIYGSIFWIGTIWAIRSTILGAVKPL